MEDNDDDYFSDDGFESLPPGTLLQLEQNAYRATQAQRAPSAPRIVTPNVQTNDTSVKPPPRLHTGLTSEYGALDVGELDAAVLDETTLMGPPSALADQLTPQEVYPLGDEGHQRQDPPGAVQNNFLSGDLEVEESYIPQHIHDEFNLRIQSVIAKA